MLAMTPLMVLGLAAIFFMLARSVAVKAAGPALSSLHSRPFYHGLYSALWVVIVGLALATLLSILWRWYNDATHLGMIAKALPDAREIEWELVLSDAKSLASGNIASRSDDFWGSTLITLAVTIGTGLLTLKQISADRRARNRSERIIRMILWSCAAIAVLTTVGIVLSLVFETLNFFRGLDWQVTKFLFGTTWSPLSGVHDGVMDVEKIGAVPLFAGTLLPGPNRCWKSSPVSRQWFMASSLRSRWRR